MNKSKISFPWFGFLLIICIAFYLYIEPSDYEFITSHFPQIIRSFEAKTALLALAVLIFLYEFVRFGRKKKAFDERIKKYEEQRAELLSSKNKLQTKVHKYSDHADKLKLFISDRLLEYIEYDEKFLHFKNIASEVRHNGVISYDKVNTALKLAEKDKNASDNEIYNEAAASMRYLWDLLDLSTTDNIAMYIANKLYEYEEQYYQQLLDENDKKQPFSPTFPAYHAVLNSLPDFVEKDKIKEQKDKKKNTRVLYEDDRLWISMAGQIKLLGNENYIALLIENLINNALFYSNNKKYGSKYSRIAIKLDTDDKNAHYQIYNAGPTIPEDVKDQIFQLGFSTRRNKGHHGKGLGLYFVSQIIKGYEGNIEFENIKNKTDIYIIRIELENGEKSNEIVKTALNKNGKPVCLDNSNELSTLEYKFKHPIKNIEVSVQSSKKTYSLHKSPDKNRSVLLDPENADMPGWCLEVSHSKTVNKAVFIPLDISGVQFHVTIPTAESRLDSDYHALENDEIEKLENPDVDFGNENIEPYIK